MPLSMGNSCRATVVGFFICIGCGRPQDQKAHWIPVTAEYHERTYLVHQDGQKVLNDEQAGIFLRTSNGSDVMFRQPVSGHIATGPGDAIVRDSKDKVAYDLLYSVKKAVIKQRWSKPSRDKLRVPGPGRFLGRKTINGLECVGTAVSGANIVSGTDWNSMPYDLTLLRTYQFKGTKPGETIELVSELTNIKLGVEPNIRKYAIPPDFEVVNPTPNNANPGSR